MNAATTANAYKTQQIMTASPEELTLMLYNGAIRFVNESIKALEQGDRAKSHSANMRAQDIVHEFMSTLDMQLEISKTWMALYDYIEYCLIQGNVKKDTQQLGEAKNMLTEMRDTWVEAIKLTRVNRAVAR
ncbi:MAG: flagellar export chaperone FliS [Negativicutes bacterium]|nr:flagellar export chaperone FliS [Negativicutes bacterium]